MTTDNKAISQGYNSLAENCSSKLDASSASQIIINGVDVSKCEYYAMCGFCRAERATDMKCDDIEMCDCYYKQLQRKTQECENNKIAFVDELNRYNLMCVKLQEEITDLLNKNESLEGERNLYKTWYRAKHNDIKDLLYKYKSALEEIEEIINRADLAGFLTGDFNLSAKIINQTRGILNKAKEQE